MYIKVPEWTSRLKLHRIAIFPRPTRGFSLSIAHLRYIAVAIVLLITWSFLPALPSIRIDQQKHLNAPNYHHHRPFRIQSEFEQESPAVKKIRVNRQQKAREAFLHAWKGYKKHAWLHDEVKPLSGGHEDPFAGWAATLVDGLDTLYIMGFQDEFEHALKALQTMDFSTPTVERIPVFETTIRYLGGLLGAYDVSEGKYPILLSKADQLGEFLLRAFNTSTGIPVPYYWWKKTDDVLQGENNVIIAQIGSLSLEFTRLAQLTGKRKYFDSISKITNHLDAAQNHTKIPGLWPSTVDTEGPSFPGSFFTLGAYADSLYEYLPKEHILLGGKTDQYLRMYRAALEPASKHHFFHPKTPGNQDILFTGSLNKFTGSGSDGPSLNPEVQHLGCFVGGMVGLGARINNSPQELQMAIRLTNSCVWAYENTASGIMPEVFYVDECIDDCSWTNSSAVELGHQHGFTRITDASYQLRPEAIESVFIMYRITGDPIWQEKGWKMFEKIEKATRTPIAHARLSDVTSLKPGQEDSMESFWLAETLKYFFLLFGEGGVVSLDDFVLNTEAHPFRQGDSLLDL